MNIAERTSTMTADAFLRWNEGREGRRELVRGKVIEMMTGATRAHVLLVRRLTRYLEDHLDARYEVLPTDLGVKTLDGVRYPDVIVEPGGGSGTDLAAIAPVFVAEILSPSSRRIDLIEKAADYMGVATLQTYVVLAQEAPRAWCWQRDTERWTGPTYLEGPETVIEVPALSLRIPLGAIYPSSRATQ
jgi:Uma2 family endonuclease